MSIFVQPTTSPDILSHVFDDDMSLPDLDDSNMFSDSLVTPSSVDVPSSSCQASSAPKPIFNIKYKKN